MMKYRINFTEEEPEKLKLKRIQANNHINGTLIEFDETEVIIRIHGFNLIKKNKRRYFYKPFNNRRKYSLIPVWYELRSKPEKELSIVTSLLIKEVVEDFKFIKKLNILQNDYSRKTH